MHVYTAYLPLGRAVSPKDNMNGCHAFILKAVDTRPFFPATRTTFIYAW